ncbi:g1373 [Coccomyxa elongata]
MEGLPSDFGEWGLESDKKLLACLQRFSAGFLSRVSEAGTSLDQLLRDTEAAEIRATDAGNRFRLLAHTHFTEQGLKDTEEDAAPSRRPLTSPPVQLTPENFDKVVHPRYLEALRIGAEAVEAAEASAKRTRPMPYLFGSPEYLQDPHGGLGPLLPGWQPAQGALGDETPGGLPEWGATAGISSAAPSTVGEFDADDFSTVEGGSETGIHRLPDFKSMLEAALRGDIGDDSASVGHGTHRSSGSMEGHPAYVAGLEPISEAQMQDEDADPAGSGPGSLTRNADMEDALHARLDVGRAHGGANGGTATEEDGGAVSLSLDFSRTISQAVEGAAAAAAPQPRSSQDRSHRRAAGEAASAKGSSLSEGAAPPLSEELLSRHSASLDETLNGGGGHQQLMGSGGVLDQLHKDIEALQLPEDVSGGLFDEDEAAEAFVDSKEEFHSPEQQLRTSPQKQTW